MQHAEKFITILIQSGARLGLADAYFYRGRALLAQGNVEAARQALIQARLEADELGARRISWQILAALAEAEALLGNETVAADLRHEARTTLEYIIDHIPKGELRASFVALPEVRQLLAKLKSV